MTLVTKFLSLSPEQRGLVFEQAAAGLAGHDVILEKDFWVSWLLGLLFAQPKLAPFLVFKGGTSLSKVFGVIDRFSEDIDLCLVPEFVGADAAGFEALKSCEARCSRAGDAAAVCRQGAAGGVAIAGECHRRRIGHRACRSMAALRAGCGCQVAHSVFSVSEHAN